MYSEGLGPIDGYETFWNEIDSDIQKAEAFDPSNNGKYYFLSCHVKTSVASQKNWPERTSQYVE